MSQDKQAGHRTLIAYVTRGGATRESAAEIASILRDKYGLEVDAIDLRKGSPPDLARYGNVIVGSGVRMGKVYREALEFLGNGDLKDKKVAIYLSSMNAGDPEKYNEAVANYIGIQILETYPNLKPVAAEAFGGRMKIFFKTTDNRDVDKVRAWADEVGKKLTG